MSISRLRDKAVGVCPIRRSHGRLVFLGCALLAILMGAGLTRATGQTAGDGAITGTVKDSTGAAIPGATVTARNTATGVETARTTDGSGVYQISPIIVGTYTVEVSAKGFQKSVQQNVAINENQVFGYNPVLAVGSEATSITVTEAPPALDTANAVLGGTITAQEFSDLPVMVANNQQRDITSFSSLLPGAQTGSRSSLFSGTANRVQEVYLDGLPLTTINQIGDNRPIFNIVPFEGIGQVGALTSGQSVEYQGAGSVNYTMKSGGNQFHGVVADYIRNRIFDTWGFTAGYATQKELINGVVTTVPVGKPVDHQNELALSIGGPIKIPHLYDGHDKLFFEFAYDKVHSRAAPVYATQTIPTTLMQQGDFTELLSSTVINNVPGPGYTIYDPTSATCVGTTCTRQPFMGMKNGVATPNVIPAGEISPISKKLQSYLPTPTIAGLQNNYLGGIPSGYDNWLYSGRIDYTVSGKQTISATVTGGNRHAVPYTGTTNVLPVPYLATTASTVAGHWADFSDTYTFTPHLVNQFKYGFSNFGGPPTQNITQNTQYAATLQGITFSGVPANGQALTEFPTEVFNGSNAQSQWGVGASGPTQTQVVETYTMVDNLLWIKGKHAITIGAQFQFLEDNTANYDGPTSSLTLNYNTAETAQENGTSFLTGTGYSYASYLMGAVGSTGITLQPFSVLGGRFRPFAPYIADDYKVTSNLTLNLGLRWDYIPTYQEALSRWSYLNPTLTNPVTGNPGTLEFAGNWGGPSVSCGCASPASTYMKNFGPRVGFAYSPTSKTVIRAAFSTLYSHGGGTGGSSTAAATGTSQLGFTSSPSFTDNQGSAGPAAGPAFYLNTSGYNALLNNANFGGPGYTVPPITPPGAISQTLNVGNTVNANGAFVAASPAPGYADPYLSGRAPEFNFWNVGIEQQLTNDWTMVLNYAGSQSHFITGAANMRGLQSGQINPAYWAINNGNNTTLLTAAATPANLAAANAQGAAAGLPTINLPYASYGLAAQSGPTGAGSATIGHALTWMPQFSGTTDTWGSQSANSSYNSAQVSFAKRASHGLQLNVNYTFSQNIDDAGTMRTGWAIPANRIASGKAWAVNRIDRSLSTNSVPHNLAIFGTYDLPFGRGKAFFAQNRWVNAIAGGFKLAEIFTFTSGTPVLITASNCSSQPVSSGTCMPDQNPAYSASSIRQNGKYGQGLTALALGSIHYLNGYINSNASGVGVGGVACALSSGPFCNTNNYTIGDAARSGQFGLRNPSTYNLNMTLFRSFNVVPGSDRLKFVLRVDCQNVTNHVTFSGLSGAVDSSAFGTFTSATSNTGSRDFQLSGRLNF